MKKHIHTEANGDQTSFYVIDSNPTDARMRFWNDDCIPTVTAHIHKASAVDPLFLIVKEQEKERADIT